MSLYSGQHLYLLRRKRKRERERDVFLEWLFILFKDSIRWDKREGDFFPLGQCLYSLAFCFDRLHSLRRVREIVVLGRLLTLVNASICWDERERFVGLLFALVNVSIGWDKRTIFSLGYSLRQEKKEIDKERKRDDVMTSENDVPMLGTISSACEYVTSCYSNHL